jgi:hypothetical protein
MPFTGYFDRFGYSPPASHPISDRYADWATDVYAAAGTAVRPRIAAPLLTTPYELKIGRLTSGSAGKGVVVNVMRGTTLAGTVSYRHLDKVPSSFFIGQKITTGTVLGYLRKWPYVAGVWEVNTPEGVHTHIEVGTVSGRACYYPYSRTRRVDAQAIGKMLPGGTATCP